MIATIGQYKTSDQVLQAAVLSAEMKSPGGKDNVGAFLDFIDRTYGLNRRGTSYVILSIGFAAWLTAFVAKAKVSVLALEPTEFISALVAGLILMLAAVGIRVYEFIVRTRAAVSFATDEEPAEEPNEGPEGSASY